MAHHFRELNKNYTEENMRNGLRIRKLMASGLGSADLPAPEDPVPKDAEEMWRMGSAYRCSCFVRILSCRTLFSFLT